MDQSVRTRPSVRQLFLVCLKIGVMSFGGAVSGWVHREFVVRRCWIDDDTFASSLAVSQILPGPNVLNLLICLGNELCAGWGVLACIAGFLIGPFHVAILLVVMVETLPNAALFEAVSAGVAFAAIGLLVGVCVRGVQRISRHRIGLVVVAVTAAAVGILKLPLIPVVMVMAPVSVLIASRRRDNA